jgi:hypothetical protein
VNKKNAEMFFLKFSVPSLCTLWFILFGFRLFRDREEEEADAVNEFIEREALAQHSEEKILPGALPQQKKVPIFLQIHLVAILSRLLSQYNILCRNSYC